MRIGMNQAEVEAFVEQLKAGADVAQIEAASGVDPAWFDVNRPHLLKLAGVRAESEQEGAGAEVGAAEEDLDAEAPRRRGRGRKGAE
jgi:hypothetical protein